MGGSGFGIVPREKLLARTRVSKDDASTANPLEELHRIWVGATEESISADLERATALAEQAPPEAKDEVDRYLQALWRLERWLHDR